MLAAQINTFLNLWVAVSKHRPRHLFRHAGARIYKGVGTIDRHRLFQQKSISSTALAMCDHILPLLYIHAHISTLA